MPSDRDTANCCRCERRFPIAHMLPSTPRDDAEPICWDCAKEENPGNPFFDQPEGELMPEPMTPEQLENCRRLLAPPVSLSNIDPVAAVSAGRALLAELSRLTAELDLARAWAAKHEGLMAAQDTAIQVLTAELAAARSGLVCFSCRVIWTPELDKAACDCAHREHWGHEWVTGRVMELTERLFEANAERDKLAEAIRIHRSQKADDRCWMDNDKLYEALGDGIKGDHRVGDKGAMLHNCERFVTNCCIEGGPWKSYAELESELASIKSGYHQLDSNWNAHHEACMSAIREACGKPDATVPELCDVIAAARAEGAAIARQLQAIRAAWRCPHCGGYDAGVLLLHCSGCGREGFADHPPRTKP